MSSEPTSMASPQGAMPKDRQYGLVVGFLAGSVVGAGVGWLLAPRISAVGKQTADSLRSLGAAASDRYHEASSQIGAVVHDVAAKGQDLRDQVSDAVIRGAQDVERFAARAKTGRPPAAAPGGGLASSPDEGAS